MNTLFKKLSTFALVAAIVLMSACTGTTKKAEPDEIMVFAAASLTNVLNELIDSFNIENKVKVRTNLASSGTLARQIEQAGAADLFISASKAWADYVDSLGLVVASGKATITLNDLVLIAPKESTIEMLTVDSLLDIGALLQGGYLSVGDPEHVPAGKYAQQALNYYGWHNKLSPQFLPAKDVRSALMVVEMGEAPLGIVYRTDAEESEKVKIVGTFPGQSHKPIVYVACLLNKSEAGKAFYDYIKSGKTASIWEKYGFRK
ncbi:MAG: molybdate ABC transporter substrate-binding protein [Mangrovibacterium sp.]